MKKVSFFMIALALSILTSVSLYSQTSSKMNVNIGKYSDEFNNEEKAATNSKAVNTFNKMFRDAKNVRWSKDDQNNDRVYFESRGKAVRAAFNKKGQMVYSIATYSEENLPADVLLKVKETYFGRSIFGVTEVHVLGKIAYLITMEDKTTWLQTKVIDGEISDEKVFIKG